MYKLKLIPLVFLIACTHGVIRTENDFFNPIQKNSDKFYTHGTQLGYTTYGENKKETYSIGQNIYTPSQKRDSANEEILKRDRPYAGWLYGEYRRDLRKSEDVSQTFAFQLGCIGRCSFAKETQGTVHRLLGQGVPTWDSNYSLKSEPGFLIFAQREQDVSKNNRYYNHSFFSGVKLGNLIDSASIGTVFKVGYLPSKKSGTYSDGYNHTFGVYTYIKGEERLVAYNHLLDGSLFQRENHTVNSEPFVQELDVGLKLVYKNFRFGYTYTLFSKEWKERPGSFAFGGIDIEW